MKSILFISDFQHKSNYPQKKKITATSHTNHVHDTIMLSSALPCILQMLFLLFPSYADFEMKNDREILERNSSSTYMAFALYITHTRIQHIHPNNNNKKNESLFSFICLFLCLFIK